MKLFDFLQTLKTEKCSFKLEYEDWSESIKVIVDTHTGVEEYCFDEDGLNEFTEFKETQSTEEVSEIEMRVSMIKNAR